MATSPKQYQPNADLEHIDDLLCEAQDRDDLSEWENEFLEDIMKSKKTFEGMGGLTMPQYKKLKEIAEKDDDFQVW